ncbi:nephrin-like isoform X2 [Littorina saxatilis]|uniref:Nephrin n=1 Tax=Littorina saxatilis TaxID=31220 RepID=A0AAN9BHM2_9CAEN
MRTGLRRVIPLSWATRRLAMKVLHVFIALTLLVSTALGAQRFQERPQDSSVIQGQTVVLKCVVADRVGRIQWVKDGFALGYDRDIPGYPTYSIIGSDPREFNLMIVNTQLRDDAEYQCQVTPGGLNDPRLTASAQLTVLVPCDVPVIQGYQNGSTVEVPYTRQSLQLVCEARNGRPAAEIEWFRNDQKVVQNVHYEVEPIVGDKRSNAKSTLSLTLHGNSENDAVYRCQAKNDAVIGRPLSTVVTISILYPPGPPVIAGYSSGQSVRTNDTLLLTCTSRGGNPLGTVVWYRNNERVDSSFTSGGDKAINEYTFTAMSTDNGVVYRCEVTNLVTTAPLTASFTLTVHFPPQRVTISGGQGPLRAGDTVDLTCVSSNSNPRSTITWFARGRQIPDNDVTNTYQVSPLGGFVTRSEVSVTLSHQEHNVIYTCQATNDVGQTVADTVTLSVLYPPNPPTISGYTEGASIRANELERMTCISVGGNPEAVLKWYKNDQLLNDAVYKVIGNIAQSEIGIVARPDDNGAVYKCTATNAATGNTPLVDTVTLTVLFPPTSVTITASTNQPRAGQGMNLTCVSSSSNPAAEILWVKGGKRIQGVNRGVVNAEHGGKNTTNVLHFIPTSSDHNAVYGCRATNTLLGLAVNDAITLTVLFPPEFVNPVPTSMDLTAGDSRNLNFTAYANPSYVSYTLYREGVQASISRFRLSSGMLRISRIRKTDGGNFTVKAENDQGSATFNFSINVKYPATIVDITSRVLEDEGGTAFFECVVDANPVTPDMITWTRTGYDMNAKSKQRLDGRKSYLTVYELVRGDTGNFKCVADNGIGEPATRNAKLIVKYAPIIDKSPENSKAASEKGQTATLTCRAEGAPDISFTWYKESTPIDTSNSKYQTRLDKSQLVHYTGTLQVRNVAREDYGIYNCNATNTKGSDSFQIALHGTSKPDSPYDLQFVNATHNSITIRWKPGFNGGLDQSFRIRYKPTEARGYIYVDVPSPAKTMFTITGLKLGTEYEMTVLAFNSLGESQFQAHGIVAKTSNISTSELQGSDEVPVIIILVVCIVGVFLLTLNVGLILFFVRRRRKRLENGSDTTSHTNTFELYGTNKAEAAMYPVAASDDTRSYGTYDKSMDDFSDDYNREYEPEYANRPFTPSKLESPRMANHKATYIMDDHGRTSPWQEDPYRVAMPSHKKGTYDNGDILYDNHTYPRDTRPKSLAELSDRPPSRPSSRAGKTPPPPPMRTTSRGDTLPPVPARNYGPQEVQPRYAPPPGSLSPNIVANPTYNGPTSRLSPTHNHLAPGSEMRGHLV